MGNDTRQQLERVKDRLQTMRTIARDDDVSIRESHDEIIGLLVTITEGVTVSSETHGREIVQQIATLEADVKHIRHDISILCKLVRDGNGQPSIIQRLANLETVVRGQADKLAEVETNANSILASKYLTKSQIIAGFSGMLVTAVLSALALFAALMKP